MAPQNQFTTRTRTLHTAVALTCAFTDTIPLKIEQNLDGFRQEEETRLFSAPTVHTTAPSVFYDDVHVCAPPTGAARERSRPVVT